VKEPEVLSVFPHIDLDHFRHLLFWLTYKRAPNGTGTNLSRSDCLDMEMEELLWNWQFLRDVWDEEDKAARRGAKG
jgi:hypothetical protein